MAGPFNMDNLDEHLEQLHGQRSQLIDVIMQLGEQGDAMQPLLQQLNETIADVEANVKGTADRKDTLSAEAVQIDAKDGLRVGSTVLVRRYNGQLCDAVVEDLEPEDSQDDENVLISWSHPRSRNEVPCRFSRTGECRRGSTCKFSHGKLWKRSELQLLNEGSMEIRREYYGAERAPCKGERVLALYFHDGVWYNGVIEEVIHHTDGSRLSAMVRMSGRPDADGQGTLTEVEASPEYLLPLSYFEVAASHGQLGRWKRRDSEDLGDDNADELEERWHGPRALEYLVGEMGGWEKYSRGVGFKLLRNMGFKAGEGLGKDGIGISEPLEIRIFQPRAGLDFAAGGRAAEFRDPEAELKPKKEKRQKRDQGDMSTVFGFISGLKVNSKVQEVETEVQREDRLRGEEGRHMKSLMGKEEQQLRLEAIDVKQKVYRVDSLLADLRQRLLRHEKGGPLAKPFRKKIAELEDERQVFVRNAERLNRILLKKTAEKKRRKEYF